MRVCFKHGASDQMPDLPNPQYFDSELLGGVGYTSKTMHSFYGHYHKVVNSLYETAQYDLSKARQLLDYADRKHRTLPDTENSKAIQMHHAIMMALRQWLGK
eukprot:4152381-Pleurochrysis_carterae.AAC.1